VITRGSVLVVAAGTGRGIRGTKGSQGPVDRSRGSNRLDGGGGGGGGGCVRGGFARSSASLIGCWSPAWDPLRGVCALHRKGPERGLLRCLRSIVESR
jgi:hypothetical protein